MLITYMTTAHDISTALDAVKITSNIRGRQFVLRVCPPLH